jgi:hypothetical protein
MMAPFVSQKLTLLAIVYLSAFAWANDTQVASNACSCDLGIIPVNVDVNIPADPSSPLNTTDTRRLRATFDIFGVLCEPSANTTQYQGT